jgi:GPH family glycoside/pentoside/hexuronide:cation symporter
MTAEKLISYLRSLRAALPAGVAVTTAEPVATWREHPELIREVDVVYAKLHPFWNGVPIEDAVNNLSMEYRELLLLAGDRPVVVSETGWPSGGRSHLQAYPSSENAHRYYLEFREWADKNRVDYFYFEAYDEQWTGQSPNDVEQHWGVWLSNGTMKFPQ